MSLYDGDLITVEYTHVNANWHLKQFKKKYRKKKNAESVITQLQSRLLFFFGLLPQIMFAQLRHALKKGFTKIVCV